MIPLFIQQIFIWHLFCARPYASNIQYTRIGEGIGFIEQRLWVGIKIEQIWVGPDYRWQ